MYMMSNPRSDVYKSPLFSSNNVSMKDLSYRDMSAVSKKIRGSKPTPTPTPMPISISISTPLSITTPTSRNSNETKTPPTTESVDKSSLPIVVEAPPGLGPFPSAIRNETYLKLFGSSKDYIQKSLAQDMVRYYIFTPYSNIYI